VYNPGTEAKNRDVERDEEVLLAEILRRSVRYLRRSYPYLYLYHYMSVKHAAYYTPILNTPKIFPVSTLSISISTSTSVSIEDALKLIFHQRILLYIVLPLFLIFDSRRVLGRCALFQARALMVWRLIVRI